MTFRHFFFHACGVQEREMIPDEEAFQYVMSGCAKVRKECLVVQELVDFNDHLSLEFIFETVQ